MDIVTRTPKKNETEILNRIWKTVFEDGGESGFFDHYYEPELTIVATHDGNPVAAGYLLPAGTLVANGHALPCAMIYGVATLPEHRGLGFGSAVVNKLTATGRSAGFPIIALCPSDDSLFEFYSARTEFREWFYIHERKYDELSLPKCNDTQATLEETPPHVYAALRKNFLTNIPHIAPDINALTYQSMLCQELGGGLFKVSTPGGDSCAILERQRDGAIWVKELLASEHLKEETFSAIISSFPAREYTVRTPARFHAPRPATPNPQTEYSDAIKQLDSSNYPHLHEKNTGAGIRRFGMLAAPASILETLTITGVLPWFGLAFD